MSHPMYEVVTGEGLMRPCFKARTGNHSAFGIMLQQMKFVLEGENYKEEDIRYLPKDTKKLELKMHIHYTLRGSVLRRKCSDGRKFPQHPWR